MADSRFTLALRNITAPVRVDAAPNDAGIDIRDGKNRTVCLVYYYPGDDLKLKAQLIANAINDAILTDVGT